ncbi:MAG: ATP-binding protein, partial [Bacteroidota bacterium]
IWVGTGSIWDNKANHGGLNRYDREQDAFVRYTHDPNDPFSLRYNEISALYEDKAGNFWVATWGNGLQLLDREKDLFYTPSANDETRTWPAWTYLKRWKNSTEGIKSIHEDARGGVWIGHYSAGLDYVDPKTNQINHYGFNPKAENSILDNIVWSIFEDRQGILWLSTWKGLNKISPQVNTLYQIGVGTNQQQSFQNEHVESVIIDDKDRLWAGTWAGLEMLDPATGKASLFKFDPKGSNKEVSQMVLDIYQEDAETYWIGTLTFGLVRFNYPQETVQYYPIIEADGSQYQKYKVNNIYQDDLGDLWVGCVHGLFHKKKDQDYLSPVQFSDASLPIAVEFSTIVQDKTHIWLGSAAGLFRYNPQNGNASPTLDTFFVSAILPDDYPFLWIGTARGDLLKFNQETEHFQTITPHASYGRGRIRGLMKDRSDKIWITSHKGLGWVDEEKGILYPQKTQDGLAQTTCYPLSYETMETGDLLIGSAAGVLGFDPVELVPDTFPPLPVITSLKVFDIDQQLPSTNASSPALEFPYHQNDLTFQYLGLQFARPEKNTYRYILDNYENEWREVGTQRSAIYPNLPPGNYTFRVQAANESGNWSTGSASLKVIIQPPWWQTLWARAIFLIGIFLALYLLYRRQAQIILKKEQEKNRIKESQLRAEVAELQTQKLKDLDEAKTRLYGNITHEFRTPLTVILGMTDQIKGNQQERELIKRNSKRLLQLINQMLDLSKLEANELKLELKRGDILVFLQYLTESFYSLAQQNEVRLLFYSELDDLVMDYDKNAIQQIIYNLLSNALKFTPKGGRIVLHAAQILKNKQPVLQLKVQDSGVGIPEAQLPHIFDRFYQADNSSTRKTEGTGIGLALTKKLVDFLEGSISAESTLHKGTSFTIRLPIHQQAPDQHRLETILAPTPKNTPLAKRVKLEDGLEKQVVLLIEDNSDIVTYLRQSLDQAYQILHAPDGRKGVEMAFEVVPDIIISDIMMPEMNGYEVCEILKNDPRSCHIPIILLTAKSSQEDRIEGLKFGADAYLVKPFHKDELLIRLEKLTALRTSLQETYAAKTQLSHSIRQNKRSSPDDDFLKKLLQVVEHKMDDPDLGVVHLCQAVRLSNTQVYRKLKALTGRTPSQFILIFRLQLAIHNLKTSDLNVSEIAYAVGFNDPNYFTRTFTEEFGLPPSEIRK